MKDLYFYLAIAAVLLFASQAKGQNVLPGLPASSPGSGSGQRGLRNNNPGNIRVSQEAWRGKIPLSKNTDGVFEQFESMEYGIRAMMVLLKTYYNRYDLKTIAGIISRWAPSSENDTTAYINRVVDCSGYPANYQLSINAETWARLAYCITLVENTSQAPDMQTFYRAYNLM